MATAKTIKLGYLSQEESLQLIEKPWDDFHLSYEKKAVDKLINTCGGQPLLIQLACSGVIKRVNQRLQASGGELFPRATLEEVEAELEKMADNTKDDDASYFFDAVWSWLTEEEKALLIDVAVISSKKSLKWVKESDFPKSNELSNILDRLVTRDVLEKSKLGYKYKVELLKIWVINRFGME